MQFILESLVAFYYFLNIHYLIASAIVHVLYVIFQLIYYSEKAVQRRTIKDQENSKQRFIKREKIKSSIVDWRPGPLFAKPFSKISFALKLLFVFACSSLFFIVMQFLLVDLHVSVINALGEQTQVVELNQRSNRVIVNYEKLKCYTVSYSTQEEVAYEVERCEPMYIHSQTISYLKHYPTVIMGKP